MTCQLVHFQYDRHVIFFDKNKNVMVMARITADLDCGSGVLGGFLMNFGIIRCEEGTEKMGFS
jgi:hypothetical protein